MTEVLRDVTVSVALVISLSFWILLYDPEYHNKRFFSNIYEHGLNSVIILIDVLVVGGQPPMRPRNFIRPLILALFYCLVTIVYPWLGGTDVLQNNFVYPILDWRRSPVEAAFNAGLTISSVPFLHLGVAYLQRKLDPAISHKGKSD